MFGASAAFGFLSHYLFLYLIIGIVLFFIIILRKQKKLNLKYLIPVIIFLILTLPHLIWLTENNYTTFTYAFHRTGVNVVSVFNHISQPIIFLGKQIGILLPFLFMISIIVSKLKIKLKKEDKKLFFFVNYKFCSYRFNISHLILFGCQN